MNYPEQVRKQIEEMQEFEKRMRGEAPQETPTLEPEGTPAEPAPVEPEGTPPVEPQPKEPEPAPEANPSQSEVDALKAELEKERQRFRTLEGKYKAEPAQLREEISQLRAQVADLSKSKEEKPAPKSMPQAIAELASTYGDNFVNALRELAREEFSHLLPDAVKPLEEKVGGFEKAQTQTAQERFVSNLVAAHPDLPSLNFDEGFLGWLQKTRMATALRDAEQQHDSEAAIEIINTYKAATGQTAKPPEPEKPPVPKPDIAPPKSRAAAPPSTEAPTKKIWTQAEITDLGRKYTVTKEISRAEYEKQMADVGRAMVEGRIR